jgi:pyruvate/2-oxoglutarate dehydrogenase complex dihydrolipoamide acyltransferase (E2) component
MANIVERNRVSDAARELARINKIDLADVKGTGAGRRIVSDDVQKMIRKQERETAKEVAVAETEVAPAKETAKTTSSVGGKVK